MDEEEGGKAKKREPGDRDHDVAPERRPRSVSAKVFPGGAGLMVATLQTTYPSYLNLVHYLSLNYDPKPMKDAPRFLMIVAHSSSGAHARRRTRSLYKLTRAVKNTVGQWLPRRPDLFGRSPHHTLFCWLVSAAGESICKIHLETRPQLKNPKMQPKKRLPFSAAVLESNLGYFGRAMSSMKMRPHN